MRKKCNFILPKPFVVLSKKRGLIRNNLRKYIIYPDLSRFKQACLGCPYIEHKDNRYYCKLGVEDFMLRFYGIDRNSPKEILIVQDTIPLELKPHRLSVRIEAYLEKHSKSKRLSGLRTKNKNPDGFSERRDGFRQFKSKLVVW